MIKKVLKLSESIKLFDFNCDVAQSYGVYKNEAELEIAKHASSINISAGIWNSRRRERIAEEIFEERMVES